MLVGCCKNAFTYSHYAKLFRNASFAYNEGLVYFNFHDCGRKDVVS